jgi:hypothetical protein
VERGWGRERVVVSCLLCSGRRPRAAPQATVAARIRVHDFLLTCVCENFGTPTRVASTRVASTRVASAKSTRSQHELVLSVPSADNKFLKQTRFTLKMSDAASEGAARTCHEGRCIGDRRRKRSEEEKYGSYRINDHGLTLTHDETRGKDVNYPERGTGALAGRKGSDSCLPWLCIESRAHPRRGGLGALLNTLEYPTLHGGDVGASRRRLRGEGSPPPTLIQRHRAAVCRGAG